MHRDLIREAEIFRFAPRGEMAVVADIDDVATEFESDEDMPDTIPNPRSLPFVPHVRVVTGQVSSKEQDRLDRERAEAEGMTPPSVLVRRA